MQHRRLQLASRIHKLTNGRERRPRRSHPFWSALSRFQPSKTHYLCRGATPRVPSVSPLVGRGVHGVKPLHGSAQKN